MLLDMCFFLLGLTAEEAAEKVEEIFFVVQSNTNATGEIVRTGHALTIVNTYPVRSALSLCFLYLLSLVLPRMYLFDCVFSLY